MNNNLNQTFNTINELNKFFDNMEDTINQFVDKVELKPIQIDYNDIYIIGFKRSDISYNEFDAHLAQIKKINLNQEWFTTEPLNEMWLNVRNISNTIMEKILPQFIQYFNSLNSIQLMMSKWKDETTNMTQIQTTIFETKKQACKDALKARKIYKNITNKFFTLDKQGNIITNNNNDNIIPQTQQKEKTEFELITCPI